MPQISPSNNTDLIEISGDDINGIDFTVGPGGVHVEKTGTLQNSGNLTVGSSGVLKLSGNGVRPANKGQIISSGRLSLDGSIVNLAGVISVGTFNSSPNSTVYNGRTIGDGGGFDIVPNSYLSFEEIYTTSTNSIHNVSNYGSIDFNIGGKNGDEKDFYMSQVFDNQMGVVNIAKGTKMVIKSNASLFNSPASTITNNGTIDNSEAPSRIIDQSTGFKNFGTYSGTGHITNDWQNNGVIQPGNSSGGMLFGGSYTQNAGSKEIQLGGTENYDFHRRNTEHDFIEVKGDMIIGDDVQLDVSLIDDFELEVDQEFIIAKVDGELAGTFDGLKEGDSVGRFANSDGGKSKLYISYKAGDGNDIALSTNRPIDDIDNANTKPPTGASLLLTAISPDASIKKNKNGSFQMEMTGVETINWFTESPDRAEGTWKPKKLQRQWDKYFSDSEPNASTTFRSGGLAGELGFANFEMFKPKIKCVDRCDATFSQYNLKFKLKPISKNGKDKLTNLAGEGFIVTGLFIDPGNTSQGTTYPPNPDLAPWVQQLLLGLVGSAGEEQLNLSGRDLTRAQLSNGLDSNDNIREPYTNLYNADFTKAILNGANLTGVDLTDADLTGADLTNANFFKAIMTDATLTDAIWKDTFCPNGDLVNSPCTAKQLIPA